MHRFFLSDECIKGNRIEFPGNVSHQIVRVLRIKNGQRVSVLDNRGWLYSVVIEITDSPVVTGAILQRKPAGGEPKNKLFLYLSLSQREKFELILQKCTEVGVNRFVPMITHRSLVRRSTDIQRKYFRWQRIILEASEQSGRGRLPALMPVQTFEEALQNAKSETDLAIIFAVKQAQWDLSTALKSINDEINETRIALFVGPEGGFTDEEVELAYEQGIYPVTLGKRILRMETAAIVGSALTLYELGDMNGDDFLNAEQDDNQLSAEGAP